ncbi:hypothetical protein [Pseudoscardovia suis]|uniref:Uncharacterized protein n=1 Tax=Pseudoscardovia suis TaxID=987063 RepID=A0A261F4Y9_9BIFI|nr:hypothetical protein [Pseudoscardovia suis]OZG53976.1 hypothetical protein PSSU_0079 [Pseudoscardovia suis]PJJ65785.1 hypothetical protein CLV65_1347 [Pseudoscardovia suis]
MKVDEERQGGTRRTSGYANGGSTQFAWSRRFRCIALRRIALRCIALTEHSPSTGLKQAKST